MAAIQVYVDRTVGKIFHFDPDIGVTTEVASASEGLTAAQVKQRMLDMNLRLR